MKSTLKYLYNSLGLYSYDALIEYFTIDSPEYKYNPLKEIYCIRSKLYSLRIENFDCYKDGQLYFICHPHDSNSGYLRPDISLSIPLEELKICSKYVDDGHFH